MQKFNPVEKKTRLHKYAFNKPHLIREKGDGYGSQTVCTTQKQFQEESILTNSKARTSNKLDGRKSTKGQRMNTTKDEPLTTMKAERLNTSMSRKTLSKMKRFNSQASTVEEKNIHHLKNYVRSITKTCNKLDDVRTRPSQPIARCTAESKREESKQFMLKHLSFCEIEEDKIDTQQTMMRDMKSIKSTSSKMMGTSKLIDFDSKKKEGYILSCLRNIDRLFRALGEMDTLGYYTKNNKFMINFCSQTKLWQSQVFLTQSPDKRDSFCFKTKYYVICNKEEVKRKLSAFLVQQDSLELSLVSHDIEELLEHIESTLSQKKIQEISNIEHYIENRLTYHRSKNKHLWKELKITHYTPEHLNFTKNLTQLEDKYGPMREISKVSRSRFDDLNRTFERLQNLL